MRVTMKPILILLCAWVLWSEFQDFRQQSKPSWLIVDSFDGKVPCEGERRRGIENVKTLARTRQQPIKEVGRSLFVDDPGTMHTFLCAPDTVDPRPRP